MDRLQRSPRKSLTRDEPLDNVMIYWLTGSGASSARLYRESFNRTFGAEGDNTVQLPVGCSIFPKDILPTPRSSAEERYKNIVRIFRNRPATHRIGVLVSK